MGGWSRKWQFSLTRIFGAYGPIMFALRVWVGLELVEGEDPYVRTTVFFQFQLDSSFMIRRTHGNMFRRALFEYRVWKDTFQNMINKNFLNKLSPTKSKYLGAMLREIHRYIWLSN